MKEWRQIPSFPDYKVSEDGDVKRFTFSPFSKAKWNCLKTHLDKDGYPRLALQKNLKGKMVHVHHLVADAFVGARPKGTEVNHIDGNKLNNHWTNLEYVTQLENLHHATRMGLRARGERNYFARLGADTVLRIRQAHAEGIPQVKIAAQFAVSTTGVCDIVNRRTWRHL